MSGRRAGKDSERTDAVGGSKTRAGARRRRDDSRKARRRAAVFYLLSAGTLGLTGYLMKPVIFGRSTPPADATVIDVSADMGGFNKRIIRVKAGEPVTLRLTSLDNQFHTDGGGRHQLAVDELGVNIIAPSLGSALQTFTPSEPGTYVFYCDICCGGRANPTMSGKLVVEA